MNNYREDFPAINNGYTYLNSASTAYVPNCVINEMTKYYQENGANAARGVDTLGYAVSKKIDEVRLLVANFINANKNEIVFTRGTTASINLLARSLGENINTNDEIIVSISEHHSNYIPWLELAKNKNAKLIIVDINDDGTINLDDLKDKLNNKTKIVAIAHCSNTYGAINELEIISKLAHEYNAYLVIDGAQGIVHNRVDVKKLDIDFYAFSGHKIYGPKGIGVLYGKDKLLEALNPIDFGGEMVEIVDELTATYKKHPEKFEGGTMMIPEIYGLGSALEYFNSIGYEKINEHINNLRNYIIEKMKKNPELIIYNENSKNSSLILFNVKGIHAHDVASMIDRNKVIIRAGHHCAQPLMKRIGQVSTLRVSFGIYNNYEDCDRLIDALEKVGDYLDVLF